MKLTCDGGGRTILALGKFGVLLLGLWLVAGCGPSPGALTLPTGTPSSMKAAANEAVVVFMRPSFYRGGKITVIIDQNRKFLGELPPGTYFVARMPPGQHRFIIWPRFHSVPVNATLEAGRTYYVEAGFAYKSAKLFAVSPRTKQWGKLLSFLTVYDGKQIREAFPDHAKGQAMVNDKEGWTRGAINMATEEWEDLDPDEIPLHTLTPADGLAEPVR
jgi:hypothetical protein